MGLTHSCPFVRLPNSTEAFSSLGFFGWFNIPIPVWVQVESVVGTARLRVQIIPDPPFIRTVQMSLVSEHDCQLAWHALDNCNTSQMGVPAVEISVTPMARALPNILDLPLLSRFVRLSIAAGVSRPFRLMCSQ